ncbi:MAG TPA: suppressor of fused domain protein [Ktedonobacterales bacterium]
MTLQDQVRAHYVSRWGEPTGHEHFRRPDFQVVVYQWAASTNDEQMTFYATAGASALPMPGRAETHRFEYYIGLQFPIDEIRRILANIAMFPLENNAGLGPGHTIQYLEPLWPGTDMNSVLLQNPENDYMPMLPTQSGLHVEFLDVLLLYPSELRYKKVHSDEDLLRLWWQKDVHYWDPNRSPEPAE